VCLEQSCYLMQQILSAANANQGVCTISSAELEPISRMLETIGKVQSGTLTPIASQQPVPAVSLAVGDSTDDDMPQPSSEPDAFTPVGFRRRPIYKGYFPSRSARGSCL